MRLPRKIPNPLTPQQIQQMASDYLGTKYSREYKASMSKNKTWFYVKNNLFFFMRLEINNKNQFSLLRKWGEIDGQAQFFKETGEINSMTEDIYLKNKINFIIKRKELDGFNKLF